MSSQKQIDLEKDVLLEPENPPRKLVALGIIGASFIGTVALISPFMIMQLRSPLPYMATPRRKVLAALKEIESRKALSKGTKKNETLTFYDLGSGDGETVLAAASVGWKATGIELNHTLWGLSLARRIFSQSQVRQNCNFVWGDIWKNNVCDAHAVMIFGVRPLMPKIAEKIAKECRPGTYVMSYRFHVPLYSNSAEDNYDNSTVTTHEKSGALRAKLVYDEEEMRIYRLGNEIQNEDEQNEGF